MTGHVAASQTAQAGVVTSMIEAGTMLAGTMTADGVNMPNHFFNPKRHCRYNSTADSYKNN